jgi:hypothetical protein
MRLPSASLMVNNLFMLSVNQKKFQVIIGTISRSPVFPQYSVARASGTAKVGCVPRTINICHFSCFTGEPKAHEELS